MMLVDQLKIVQADAFTLYLKAHFYHWNIEGPNFPQYHDFLQNFYEDVFASVDREGNTNYLQEQKI